MNDWGVFWDERLHSAARRAAKEGGDGRVTCATYFYRAGAEVSFFDSRCAGVELSLPRFRPRLVCRSIEEARDRLAAADGLTWTQPALIYTDSGGERESEEQPRWLEVVVARTAEGAIIATRPRGGEVRPLPLVRFETERDPKQVLQALTIAQEQPADSWPRLLRGLLMAAAEAAYAREQTWLHQKTSLMNENARRLAARDLEAHYDHGDTCAQVFFDIDNFKAANASLGYETADRVVGCVANAIRRELDRPVVQRYAVGSQSTERHEDQLHVLPFHVSGDEFKLFVVGPVFQGTPAAARSRALVSSFAGRLVKETAVAVSGTEPEVVAPGASEDKTQAIKRVLSDFSISAGFAVLLPDNSLQPAAESLLEALDRSSERALDAAKRTGKNRAFASDDVYEKGGVVYRDSTDRLSLSLGTEDGIEKGAEFHVFARPDDDLVEARDFEEPNARSPESHSGWLGRVRAYHVEGRSARVHAMEGVRDELGRNSFARAVRMTTSELRRPRRGTPAGCELSQPTTETRS